jgi:hypothetical protein
MRLVAIILMAAPTTSYAADLWQVPAIVAGKKAKGSDWRAAAKLEAIVQKAAQKADHNLTALRGDAGKKALACKGNVDCLGKIAAGKPGYAVVIVVWALKRKRLGEVALFDLKTMKKIGNASGPINAKLGAALVNSIPAPPPPVKEVKTVVREPAPDTELSAKKESVSTGATTSFSTYEPAPATRRWSQWAGLGLGIVGAGLAAYSTTPVGSAQNAYNSNATQDTSAELTNAVNQANLMLSTGTVGVVLGAGLWMWAP